jgi:nitrogen fixation/metabolism regulation signal transduction histidine kinase
MSTDGGGSGGARTLRLGRTMFVVVVVALLVLLATTWFIVNGFVAQPLDNVIAAARRVAEGDYSKPVPLTGGDDEIQQVVSAFNTMMVELDQFQGQLKERIGEAVRNARRTQESLVIAQRLAATGRLAAGIAHEVNNPLAGMLNAVSSLRTKEMSAERSEEYLELVEEGLQRIQRTVAKILQFTPHKVAPRDVSLDEVVRPVLALARHRIERDEVETVLELAEDALVFGDLYELQQALLNVVLNALDAMADVPERDSRLFLRVQCVGDEVHMLVRDNGTGMSQADRERAFDLFFTTKETGKGSGMGLATVHKILSDHGGRVDLISRDSDGMDVVLILPRVVRA